MHTTLKTIYHFPSVSKLHTLCVFMTMCSIFFCDKFCGKLKFSLQTSAGTQRKRALEQHDRKVP